MSPFWGLSAGPFCGFSEASLGSVLFPTVFLLRSELLRSAQCATGGTEQASVYFNSGAGFSVYTPTPPYQKKAVDQYFANTTGLPNQTLYNRHRAPGCLDARCLLGPGITRASTGF